MRHKYSGNSFYTAFEGIVTRKKKVCVSHVSVAIGLTGRAKRVTEDLQVGEPLQQGAPTQCCSHVGFSFLFGT